MIDVPVNPFNRVKAHLLHNVKCATCPVNITGDSLEVSNICNCRFEDYKIQIFNPWLAVLIY
jgi:hypothetical protein